jgi:hypothetical protein
MRWRQTSALTQSERDRLLALGNDVERAWYSTARRPASRMRIIRTLIEEIVVRVENEALSLVISLGWRRPHAFASAQEPRGATSLDHR